MMQQLQSYYCRYEQGSISSHAMTRPASQLLMAKQEVYGLRGLGQYWRNPLNSLKKSISKAVCPLKCKPNNKYQPCSYGPMKPVGLRVSDDYKGPRDGEFKTPYLPSFSCAKQCGCQPLQYHWLQTHLNGADKTGLQMIQVWNMRSLSDTSHAPQFPMDSPSAWTNLPFTETSQPLLCRPKWRGRGYVGWQPQVW